MNEVSEAGNRVITPELLTVTKMNPSKSYLYAIAAFILFGSTSLVVKPSRLTPVTLVCLRMLITAAALFPVALFRRTLIKNIRKPILFALIATSTTIFVNMVFLFQSFKLAPVAVCVAIFYTGPIFTVLIRSKRSNRRLSSSDKLAIGIALLAIIILVASGLERNLTGHPLGYLLAFLGGLFFGLIPIFEEGCAAVSPDAALTIQASFAALCLLPFVELDQLHMNGRALQDVIILAILFTLIPFLLWWYATRINSQLSPFVLYCDPITASLLGTFVLGERISLMEASATVLLGLGAIIHVYRSRKSI